MYEMIQMLKSKRNNTEAERTKLDSSRRPPDLVLFTTALGRVGRPKPQGRINYNHKAEYSDQMAELIEIYKADFYH